MERHLDLLVVAGDVDLGKGTVEEFSAASADGELYLVGYVEFAQFISTADPQLEQVFAEFRANGVTDVIADLRYNGGGLVSTAELFGDYLGGDVAENLIFSETRYNADRAAENNRTEFFERLGNSISLEELVIVATGSTASASELVTNGMEPHVSVTIVGYLRNRASRSARE